MKVRDTKPARVQGKFLNAPPTHPLNQPKPLSTPLPLPLGAWWEGRGEGGGVQRWTGKVPSPLLQLCGWSHKEASLCAKDARIDSPNLAESLRLARTWTLLLFFKPRIRLQLYLDAGLVLCGRAGGKLLQEPQECSTLPRLKQHLDIRGPADQNKHS